MPRIRQLSPKVFDMLRTEQHSNSESSSIMNRGQVPFSECTVPDPETGHLTINPFTILDSDDQSS